MPSILIEHDIMWVDAGRRYVVREIIDHEPVGDIYACDDPDKARDFIRQRVSALRVTIEASRGFLIEKLKQEAKKS